MNLFCAITNAIIAVLIYIFLVYFLNNNKTPQSIMNIVNDGKTTSFTMDRENYTKSLEMFLFISVFLSFFVNKIIINGCI